MCCTYQEMEPVTRITQTSLDQNINKWMVKYFGSGLTFKIVARKRSRYILIATPTTRHPALYPIAPSQSL
jgi:hypothetical protein